jgi:hypothetical protein
MITILLLDYNEESYRSECAGRIKRQPHKNFYVTLGLNKTTYICNKIVNKLVSNKTSDIYCKD